MATAEKWILGRHKGAAPFAIHLKDLARNYWPAIIAPDPDPPGTAQSNTGVDQAAPTMEE